MTRLNQKFYEKILFMLSSNFLKCNIEYSIYNWQKHLILVIKKIRNLLTLEVMQLKRTVLCIVIKLLRVNLYSLLENC